MFEVNIYAVMLAATSSFMLGGLWYSPLLFGKLWMIENKIVEGEGNPLMIFGISFVLSVISAWAFAVWVGPSPEMSYAIHQGLVVGLLFVCTSMGINYQFSQRGFLLWAIDGGYHVAQFLLFGVVLGVWH